MYHACHKTAHAGLSIISFPCNSLDRIIYLSNPRSCLPFASALDAQCCRNHAVPAFGARQIALRCSSVLSNLLLQPIPLSKLTLQTSEGTVSVGASILSRFVVAARSRLPAWSQVCNRFTSICGLARNHVRTCTASALQRHTFTAAPPS